MRALKDPRCWVVTTVCVQPSPAASPRTFRPASSRGSARPSDAASHTGNPSPSTVYLQCIYKNIYNVSTVYLQYIYISTAASPAISSRAAPTATARRTEPGARTCCRSANVSNTCLKPRVTCGEQRATCHGSEDVICQFLWIQFFSLLSSRYCPAKSE